MPLNRNRFHENTCRAIHALLIDVNSFLIIIFIFLGRYGYYLVLNIKSYCCSEIVSCLLTKQ